jgi:hypothetical protein
MKCDDLTHVPGDALCSCFVPFLHAPCPREGGADASILHAVPFASRKRHANAVVFHEPRNSCNMSLS